MPRCIDDWRRGGDVTVFVKATCDDQDRFYSLTYVYFPRQDLALRLGGSFNSAQLAAGVDWQVPEGHRCGFQLLTTGKKAIHTEIKLNGEPVHQGDCTAGGSAGIAGDWTVTGVRMST